MRNLAVLLSLAAAASVALTVPLPTAASAASAASAAVSKPAKMPPAPLQVVGTLPARQPLDALADPASGDIFVTNTGSNTVSVFSATGRGLANLRVGNGPRQLAVDDTLGYVYVTNFYSNTVSVISTTGGAFSVLESIPVGANPDSVAVDPDTDDVYVTDSADGAGQGMVSVIEPAVQQVVSTIDVGSYPSGIAYDPDNGDLYVNDQWSASVSIVDPQANAVIGTIDLAPGAHPHGVTVDPALATVYVADDTSNAVTAINDVSNQITYTAPAGDGAHHVAYDSAQNLFVTDYTSASIAALKPTGQAIGGSQTCRQPDGISYDSNTSDLYVACEGSNEVEVLFDAAAGSGGSAG